MNEEMVARCPDSTTCDLEQLAAAVKLRLQEVQFEGSVETALHEITILIARAARADHCSLMVPLGRHAMQAVASSDQPRPEALVIDLNRYPELVRTKERDEALLIEDVRQSPIVRPVLPLLEKVGLVSIAAVPVAIGPSRGLLRLTTSSNALDSSVLGLLSRVGELISRSASTIQRRHEDSSWRRLALDLVDLMLEVSAEGRVLAAIGESRHADSHVLEALEGADLFSILEPMADYRSRDPRHSLLEQGSGSRGVLMRTSGVWEAGLPVSVWSTGPVGIANTVRLALRFSDAEAVATGSETVSTSDLAEQRVARLRASLEEQLHEIAELRAQIDELEMLRTRFLSASAHELKTPLTVIQSYLETLVTDLSAGLSEDQLTFLRIAHESVLRLRRLVIDLVDLAALTSGKIKLDIVEVDLQATVDEVLGEMLPIAEHSGVELRCGDLSRVRPARADAQRLQQVLRNLLDNAIKFTPTGGFVNVGALERGDTVVLSIADTGVGIPPERQLAIFDEFAQAGGPPVRQRRGSGLGLAITRRIVRSLGGRIELHSVEGEGTVFEIHLPQWPDELS